MKEVLDISLMENGWNQKAGKPIKPKTQLQVFSQIDYVFSSPKACILINHHPSACSHFSNNSFSVLDETLALAVIILMWSLFKVFNLCNLTRLFLLADQLQVLILISVKIIMVISKLDMFHWNRCVAWHKVTLWTRNAL